MRGSGDGRDLKRRVKAREKAKRTDDKKAKGEEKKVHNDITHL